MTKHCWKQHLYALGCNFNRWLVVADIRGWERANLMVKDPLAQHPGWRHVSIAAGPGSLPDPLDGITVEPDTYAPS